MNYLPDPADLKWIDRFGVSLILTQDSRYERHYTIQRDGKVLGYGKTCAEAVAAWIRHESNWVINRRLFYGQRTKPGAWQNLNAVGVYSLASAESWIKHHIEVHRENADYMVIFDELAINGWGARGWDVQPPPDPGVPQIILDH